jgi:hypothetical protein
MTDFIAQGVDNLSNEAHISGVREMEKPEMTKLEKARKLFAEYLAAQTAHDFGRGPKPNPEQFGYRHGWVTVEGEAFNHEMCFGKLPTYDA